MAVDDRVEVPWMVAPPVFVGAGRQGVVGFDVPFPQDGWQQPDWFAEQQRVDTSFVLQVLCLGLRQP